MTKVYFVRHAKPDFSIKDDLMRPLTEDAINDCKKVTEFLSDKNITKAFSSPYKRAIDTIRDFTESLNLEINVIDDFRERKIGNTWIEDFDKFAKEQWTNFDYKLPEGESLNEVQKRNIKALMHILKENADENIVIGSHGTALSTIINYFNKEFGYTEFERIKNLMPFIVCFTFDGQDIMNIEEFIME
ncbi:histidine phosphatase family protein [Thermoanaerobacterium sp. RBIITD]|uniref:histidine phosphatase family protein n=1 Tax=Thermoanaerobacterium sp. RBIITD TaxID=1550240 RepID=UPI000BB718BD|nr:histidine phosphatase family protein [Thermoanaerobacterium sp. RBIITD]SNX54450.1 2,3-bisphosphoglycerate-dependent phosphoglycerate mutase [Thermoanaerobacterium sp. RBIITD]